LLLSAARFNQENALMVQLLQRIQVYEEYLGKDQKD